MVIAPSWRAEIITTVGWVSCEVQIVCTSMEGIPLFLHDYSSLGLFLGSGSMNSSGRTPSCWSTSCLALKVFSPTRINLSKNPVCRQP